MKKTILFASLALLFLSFSVRSQHDDEEGCHVYIVDVERSKGFRDLTDAQVKECEKDSEKCGVKEFTKFSPIMAEEELTLKTYKFPWAPLTITASVYITDEMWLGDTATLTITLAQNSPKGVQADENSAQTDIVLGRKWNAAKVKRYYRIKNKQYLVGLQCVFGEMK